MNKSATWGRGSHTLTFVLGTIFFKFQVRAFLSYLSEITSFKAGFAL